MTGSSSDFACWELLQQAVHRALAPYPAGTATVVVGEEEPFIEIIPRNDRAAKICLSPFTEEVFQILAGVMAGTLEECGERMARVDAPRGQISFGSASLLPVPWSWRTRHRYERYN